MAPIVALIGSNAPTLVLGTVLVLGVLVFAWLDHRRTSRLPPLGTVMVKNRLKSYN